jgi:hypothetical protein
MGLSIISFWKSVIQEIKKREENLYGKIKQFFGSRALHEQQVEDRK